MATSKLVLSRISTLGGSNNCASEVILHFWPTTMHQLVLIKVSFAPGQRLYWVCLCHLLSTILVWQYFSL